jgi:hypothetical protein
MLQPPRTRLLAAFAAVAILGCGSAACGKGVQEEARVSSRPFAPGSVWNRPLRPKTPRDPHSAALVRELRRQVRRVGPWINSYEYSVPVYRVPRSERRVRVKLDTNYDPLERAISSVPVPRRAKPAKGSDSHMVVWQPSTDTMWEFWRMHRRRDGWHTRWGGRMDHVSRNPGAFPAPLGATATGLPLLGGLIRPGELRSGHIRHALAFSMPEARAGTFASPATRTDGQVRSRRAIPLGTRFRLDPRVDVDSLGLPPGGRAIAEAVQRYGMIARDKSGSVSFYAEAPRPGRPYDLRKLLGGLYPNQTLAKFPWSRLQAMRARDAG